jgi:uncharacterized protein YjiS (DUF1127 family)
MIPSMSSSKSPIVPVLATAASTAVNAAVAFVRATWKARRHRRAVGNLVDFDDHMLRDIGLTRGDVAAALAGPAFDDPSTRLRIFAVERRAGRRAQVREWLEAEAAAAPPPVVRLGASV